MDGPVRWEDLRPDQFVARRIARPVVYLPVGLCEPHGHVAALGLDTHKARWLCERAAMRVGGIVAPTQGYHVHESGFHAAWLDDVVGDEVGGLASLSPRAALHHFLYQLRAFANNAFRHAIVVTGHVGGSERDLASWSAAFSERFPLSVIVTDDVTLSGERGDHAGRYEISALMHVAPELVDLTLLDRATRPGGLGRLALGDDAGDASPEHGRRVMERALERLCLLVEGLPRDPGPSASPMRGAIGFADVERLYASLCASADSWVSSRPHDGQTAVAVDSPRRSYEYSEAAELGRGKE